MTARCPSGLGPAGRRLWRETCAEWSLQAADLILLEQACAAADRCAELRVMAAGQPPMIVDAVHTELRAERRSLVLLLQSLDLLSDADDDAPPAGQLAPVVPLEARRHG